MATPRRRRYVPGDVQAKVEELTDQGRAPKQIEDLLLKDPEFATRLPNLRTIQRMVASRLDASGRRDSDFWQLQPLATDQTPDRRVVLDVLGYALDYSHGQVSGLTEEQARWVTALSVARPSLSPGALFHISTEYIARRRTRQSTSSIDIYLAYKPWEHAWRAHGYTFDILMTNVPPPPPSIVGDYQVAHPITVSESRDDDAWGYAYDDRLAVIDEANAWRSLRTQEDAFPWIRRLHEWAIGPGRTTRSDNGEMPDSFKSMEHEYAFGLDLHGERYSGFWFDNPAFEGWYFDSAEV